MSLTFRPNFYKIPSNLIRTIFVGTNNYSSAVKSEKNPKKCPKRIPYTMCSPMVEEYDTVIDIVNRITFNEEPSLKFLGITMNPFIERLILDKLNEGHSLLAKCKYTGRIVGIALNETIKPWEDEITSKQASMQSCPKTKEMLRFWAYLTKMSNPFENDPCLYEVFKSTILYMDRFEQKFGLGRMIAKECINVAIRNKYKKIKCRAANAHYAGTLRKLGMTEVLHVPFENYTNVDGVKVLKCVPQPNIGVKVYVMDLRDKEELEVC